MAIIRIIDTANQIEVQNVIDLHRKHKSTLGPLPYEAFIRSAEKGEILTAWQNDTLVGYLLYRKRKRDQACCITHLCVSKKARGQGFGDDLLRQLVKQEEKQHASFIRLSCKETPDYKYARELWARFGFRLVGEKRGRNQNGDMLQEWQLPITNFPLFQLRTDALLSEKTGVVIDMNIFLDLLNPANDNVDESTQALMANWVQDEIELFCTPEIDQEISRNQNPKEKRRANKFRQSFPEFPVNTSRFHEVCKKLNVIFDKNNEQDESDKKHLAWAIAAQRFDYFVTRDNGLLHGGDRILEEFAIKIQTPAQILLSIDELLSPSGYRPVSLEGTEINRQKVVSEELPHLYKYFSNSSLGERKKTFEKIVSKAIQNTECSEIIKYSTDKPHAMAILDYGDDHVKIPMLRMGAPMSYTTTLARRLLHDIVTNARNRSGDSVIIVDDACLQTEMISALSYTGFVLVDPNNENGKWVKLTIGGVFNQKQLIDRLASILGKNQGISDAPQLKAVWDILNCKVLSPEDALAIEHFFWPLKIIGTNAPCWIVPIQPNWAAQLIDEDLSRQQLYDRKLSLGLNIEAVFYNRSPHPVQAPARILWYISKGNSKGFAGIKAIRSCSALIAAEQGIPKELFRRFQHLGVFQWNDLMNIVKGDTNKKIKAFHFHDTENFSSKIALADIKESFKEQGVPVSVFPTAHEISEELFFVLYSKGVEIDNGIS